MSQQRTTDRIEDLQWLDDNACTIHDAVRQTGIPERNLEKFCERHGLDGVFQRLKHRGHACTHHCLRELERKGRSVDESRVKQGDCETMGAQVKTAPAVRKHRDSGASPTGLESTDA